jgi:hypothetical protein
MEPEVKSDFPSSDVMAEEVKVSISPEDTGTIVPVSTTTKQNEEWRQTVDQVTAFIAELPDYLGEFFNSYKRPLTSIGLVLAFIIAIRMVLAVLDSLNDIPLVGPTFELIGFGYVAWFVYRYLLRESSRRELAHDFTSLKEQVLGSKLSKD